MNKYINLKACHFYIFLRFHITVTGIDSIGVFWNNGRFQLDVFSGRVACFIYTFQPPTQIRTNQQYVYTVINLTLNKITFLVRIKTNKNSSFTVHQLFATEHFTLLNLVPRPLTTTKGKLPAPQALTSSDVPLPLHIRLFPLGLGLFGGGYFLPSSGGRT